MALATNGRASPCSSAVYNFKQQLAVEAENQQYMELLFMPHTVVDMTQDKREQKNGNDFFLYPCGDTDSTPIRVENKFEAKVTGNFVLEFVSYDRPKLAPGWVFTSRCSTLLSWFPTGEVCVWQMSELRKWAFERIRRYSSTTTLNPSYLTWNLLPKIEDALRELPNSRVLDLRYELGFENKTKRKNLISAELKELRGCTVEELILHLQRFPRESKPAAARDDHLVRCMQILEERNFMRNHPRHLSMIDKLPADYQLQGSRLLEPA